MALSIPATVSWEEIAANGGAYRPALVATLGGALLQDEQGKDAPATDGSELFGLMVNQWVKQIAAMARTVSPLKVTVDWSAGNPIVAAYDACSSILIAADLTLIKNGTGDVTIQWASASKLPPLTTDMIATINSIALSQPNIVAMIVATPPANTVQIRIQTKDGSTLTNARFTVRL